MKLLKDFAMLFAAVAIPVILVLVMGVLIDTIPVLGWIVTVIILTVSLYLLTGLVRLVRGK